MPYNILKEHINYNYSPGVHLTDLWGMVVHCTADPGAAVKDEFHYLNTGNRNASGSAYIDNTTIAEFVTLDPGKVEKAWHAGRIANDHYIGVELCMPQKHDVTYFKNVWDRAVWYFAYKFVTVIKQTKIIAPVYKKGLPVEKGNLMSHHEVTLLWHQSTHVDPDAYFAEYGKTVNDFRLAVQNEIDRLSQADMSIDEAIDILSNTPFKDGGFMINNPDLWKKAFKEKKLNTNFVKLEFIRMAKYIDSIK